LQNNAPCLLSLEGIRPPKIAFYFVTFPDFLKHLMNFLRSQNLFDLTTLKNISFQILKSSAHLIQKPKIHTAKGILILNILNLITLESIS
jgi:hypothetical protein